MRLVRVGVGRHGVVGGRGCDPTPCRGPRGLRGISAGGGATRCVAGSGLPKGRGEDRVPFVSWVRGGCGHIAGG